MARARSGRGGSRQGTPGKSYSNRKDLLTNYGQSAPGASAASGGMAAPAPAAQQPQQTWITPDQVPKLDDPTTRPNEPVTHGLDSGPGGGSEVLGVTPGSQAITSLRAAYLRNPTPELRRAIALVQASGWH